jgi:hypothetical protein
MPLGMVCVCLYLIGILRINPYLRTDDDRLHVLGQAELLLLFLAGNVFAYFNADTYSYSDDVLMSILLVGITLLFMAVFAWAALWLLYSTVSEMCMRYRRGAQAAPAPATPMHGASKQLQGEDDLQVVVRDGNGAVVGSSAEKKAEEPVAGAAEGVNEPDVDEEAVKEQIRRDLAAAPAENVALLKRFLLPPLALKPAAPKPQPITPSGGSAAPASGFSSPKREQPSSQPQPQTQLLSPTGRGFLNPTPPPATPLARAVLDGGLTDVVTVAPSSAAPSASPAPDPAPAPAAGQLPSSPIPPISALPITSAPSSDGAEVAAAIAAAGPDNTASPGATMLPNTTLPTGSEGAVQGAVMIAAGGAANPSAGVPVPATPNSTNETTITSPAGDRPAVPATPFQG